LRGQFNFAERRAGMEEIELDRLRDTRLHRPNGFRGPRGQDGDPRLGEMPLQTPHRRERDEAIADVVELEKQDLADVIAIERRPAGNQDAVWFAVGRKIVLMAREMRAQYGSPARNRSRHSLS